VLIFVVLICPYLCPGDTLGSGSAPVATGSIQAGCRCCSGQQQSEGETPSSPADQDADCLCRGAIMDGQLRSVELDPPHSSMYGLLVDDATLSLIGHSLATFSLEPPRHFPPFSTGWDVRVLTCALIL
jgi:hypothetical protein